MHNVIFEGSIVHRHNLLAADKPRRNGPSLNGEPAMESLSTEGSRSVMGL
jgi:hypothetical protein